MDIHKWPCRSKQRRWLIAVPKPADSDTPQVADGMTWGAAWSLVSHNRVSVSGSTAAGELAHTHFFGAAPLFSA
jgi:hypothetical protein